jgi:hypothetical protein
MKKTPNYEYHPIANVAAVGSTLSRARIGNVDTCPLRVLRRRCWGRCWGWGCGWSWSWGSRRAAEVGQHEFSRQIRMCIHKRAVASSLDHELLVTIRINLECGHCLRAAAEGCYERPRRLSRADLVVDEVPGAGPIARGADVVAQVRRTRPSHQLMLRYCDQGEHGQQQRELFVVRFICILLR